MLFKVKNPCMMSRNLYFVEDRNRSLNILRIGYLIRLESYHYLPTLLCI